MDKLEKEKTRQLAEHIYALLIIETGEFEEEIDCRGLAVTSINAALTFQTEFNKIINPTKEEPKETIYDLLDKMKKQFDAKTARIPCEIENGIVYLKPTEKEE